MRPTARYTPATRRSRLIAGQRPAREVDPVLNGRLRYRATRYRQDAPAVARSGGGAGAIPRPALDRAVETPAAMSSFCTAQWRQT